jgi:hypothetical protein
LYVPLDIPTHQFSALELVVALPPESLGFSPHDYRLASRLRGVADQCWAGAEGGRVRAELPLDDVQFVINCTAMAMLQAPYEKDALARTVRLRLSELLGRLEEAIFASPAMAAA